MSEKSTIERVCEDYQVLCGVEEEFLIINKDGTLAPKADEMMRQCAIILEKESDLLDRMMVKISGLDAEPNPAQIEYVTLPLPPDQIEDAIRCGRQLLQKAAEQLDVKILAQSMHPIESAPHPIAGTHINISVQRKESLMTPDLMKVVYNYFWNYLPELIAISANSPVYKGTTTNLISNRISRSTVLKHNGYAVFEIPDRRPALIPMHYYGRRRYKLRIGTGMDKFSKRVYANVKGSRLMDISPRGPSSNISDDRDTSPTTNRVEIRIFDVQPATKDLVNIAHLCCVSALDAVAQYLDKVEINFDSYHEENLTRAIQYGSSATLIRDKNEQETIIESLDRWIDNTAPYQKSLGISLDGILESLPEKPNQSPLNIEYKTKDIERLRQAGRTLAQIQFSKSRIVRGSRGQKYKVPKGAKIDGTISVDYSLEYVEEDGVVKNFENMAAINILQVQDIMIPLEPGDKVLSAMSKSDYMTRRLFGGFPFMF